MNGERASMVGLKGFKGREGVIRGRGLLERNKDITSKTMLIICIRRSSQGDMEKDLISMEGTTDMGIRRRPFSLWILNNNSGKMQESIVL